MDVALQAYFDPSRPPLLLAHVAQRGQAPEGLHGLKLGLHASGQTGGAPGGGLSPLLRHLYLTTVERRLEQAHEGTRRGASTDLADARFAAERVSLVEASPPHAGLLKAVDNRLWEAWAPLQGHIHEAKR